MRVDDLTIREHREITGYVPQCVIDFAYRWAALLENNLRNEEQEKVIPVEYRIYLKRDTQGYGYHEFISQEAKISFKFRPDGDNFLSVYNTGYHKVLSLEYPTMADPSPTHVDKVATNSGGLV